MWKFGIAFGLSGAILASTLLNRNEKTGRYQFIIVPNFYLKIISALAKRTFNKMPREPQQAPSYKLINEIFDIIKRDMHSEKNWNLTVISDPGINVFALPDGSMYVYTGLLNYAESPDELAFIMSHEFSHVALNHIAEKLTFGVFSSFIITWLSYKLTGDMDLTFLKDILIDLPLSEKSETEADNEALEIINKSGFNAKASLKVMERLNSQSSKKTQDYLSSHPITSSRISALEYKISELSYTCPEPNSEILKLSELLSQTKTQTHIKTSNKQSK